MVHSLFASTDDWDNQLEGTESGWPGFFRILRLYLTHFRGQRSAIMQWMAPAAGTEAEAWDTLTAALGVKGVSAGQRWTAPRVSRRSAVWWSTSTENPYDALLRLDTAGAGIAALGAVNCGGPIMVAMSFYHYGDQASGTVARETPLWQAWIQERFPMPTEPSRANDSGAPASRKSSAAASGSHLPSSSAGGTRRCAGGGPERRLKVGGQRGRGCLPQDARGFTVGRDECDAPRTAGHVCVDGRAEVQRQRPSR